MSYKYLEDIATADIAFEAVGRTTEEAFENAAKATFNIITDIKDVKRETEKKLVFDAEDLKALLFEWIDGLLFYWDSENLIFSDFVVKIKEASGRYNMEATAKGEPFDPKRHEVKQNVKSPTYHLMEIENQKDRCKIRMVIDI
ncbi:MAG: archease [Candidatus Aenigmarchaeota archaeon]|nr:archease [Candidatus Aenigmarchaeota archaeon]